MPRPRLAWVLLMVVVSACSTRGDAPPGAPPHKVRVAFSPYVSWGPLIIAQSEGYFRNEGLEIEFVSALHSEESLVALITGDLDVRPGPLSAGFLSAVSQGARIRIVAGMGYLARDGCPYFGIILRRGIDTVGVPAIKRMRTSQDGYTRFLVSRMLAQRGVQLEDIETLRLPAPVMVSSLQSGAVDAIAASEPTLSRVAGAGQRWVTAQESSPDFQWGVIAFGERFLSREPDLGVRFLRAYRRGLAQYALGKTARNVTIIAQATGETPQATGDACWPAFQSDARPNWGSIATFQSWARAEGLLDQAVSESAVWDSSFVMASDRAAEPRKR
ncbi:MAG: ABC transporter substrate-binding protein [Gemmatimonadaceae bacterium]|nr:ABC transporter substrate-binding protein [Gemmatimonadaceae bacterium]